VFIVDPSVVCIDYVPTSTPEALLLRNFSLSPLYCTLKKILTVRTNSRCKATLAAHFRSFNYHIAGGKSVYWGGFFCSILHICCDHLDGITLA
jgi:hypothetical protein